jgi:molybdopterin/thiamine biosynthesis adenylyltransferase
VRDSATLLVELEDEHDRYHRQALISWWDQARLRDSVAIVVGAGALGNELVKNLALVGVGAILVVDFDVVEHSNLSRCVFFRAGDEGREKALVVAERARELNPEVEITGIHGDVRSAIGLGTFREAAVVLGGLDNREARVHVNRACWKTTTPWVDGAIEGLMGVVRAFVPPDSPCYECTMNARDRQLLAARRACTLLSREEMESGKVPTTATTSSIVAGMQIQEAVKLLHRDRLDYAFAGKGFVFNGLTHDSYVVEYSVPEALPDRETYELDEVRAFGASATLGELLESACEDLGPDAVLDLELEMVLALDCRDCGFREPIHRPAVELGARDARCARCGAQRMVDAIHTVDRSRGELLDLTVRELGLPANDLIAARRGLDRRHYSVATELSPFARPAGVAG